MLAKFGMKGAKKFPERFSVPSHEFSEKKRGDSGVALGKIKAEADATALFAAYEDILFEHEFANVFEADGNFVKLAIEFCGEFVDELGDGKGFCDVAREIAHASKVPDEKRKDLVRIDERAVAVDGADAVTV